MIIRGEVITTSGFSENILGLQNTPIGMAKVKRDVYELKSGRNVNCELSYNYFRFFGKKILVFQNTPIGVGKVKKMNRI